MLTPLEITTLLNVYCYPNNFVTTTGVGRCWLKNLIEPQGGITVTRLGPDNFSIGGLISAVPFMASSFALTARGKAMVAALRQLPLPQPFTETVWDIPGTDFEFPESEL